MSKTDHHATTAAESKGGGHFAAQAESATPGLVRELWDFLRDNKKWWLAPIIAILLLVGALLLAGGSAAPFIYTLF